MQWARLAVPRNFEPVVMREKGFQELILARREKHAPEQVVNLMCSIGAAVAQGNTTALICEEAAITELSDYCWRKQRRPPLNQARRLKALESENIS